MLQNPLSPWRRGFDYQGFSPLKQITKGEREQPPNLARTFFLSGPNEGPHLSFTTV